MSKRSYTFASIARTVFVGIFALFFLSTLAATQTCAGSVRDASNNPADMQAPAAQSDGMATSNDDYRLGNGDKGHISGFHQRDLTDIYQLDGLGRIAFPLV